MAKYTLTTALLFATAFAFPGFNTQQSNSGTAELSKRSPDIYQTPGWVPHGETLQPRHTQDKTNGNSKLGTLEAPKLGHYLADSPLPKGKPWADRTAATTNPYKDLPNTGVTRHYAFIINEQDISPDGVTRPGMVVNGGYPGPTIEANWGDYIEVVVHNGLPHEGTSIHWHGLLQHDTPYFDGVPGTQQCPIAPNTTLTYRFRADLYGTSFWHSHYSAQYTGGIFGAMIIHGPHDNAEYDEDLGPIILNDYYHQEYYEIVEQVMAPISAAELPPVSNNNLINGKMNYPCANATGLPCTPNAGISRFSVESGKTYRLRLINAGAEGIQKFSIDGAELTVFANDFVPLHPYKTNVVTLGVGQRTDVLFKATGKSTDAVWMRSTLGPSGLTNPKGCTNNDGVSPEAVAAIYYEKADTSSVPKTKSSVTEAEITTCDNDDLSKTTPYFKLTPDPTPEQTQQINITFQSNGTHNLFYMNNSTFRADYNDAILLKAKLGHQEFEPAFNVYSAGSNKTIRLVVYNHAQTSAHPMHMHGHNMYVLATGTGNWDGVVTNADNPQRRDVQLIQNAPSKHEPSYIVLQLDADNPGIWPFHCHIAWHVSAGLYVAILERPDDIQAMSIPSVMAQTCRNWAKFTGQQVPDEIDSGL